MVAQLHPILVGLGILFGLGVVVAYWPVFVAAGVAFGCVPRGASCDQSATPSTPEGTRRIAARADYEHAAMMRGYTWRGTFGQFEPAPWWCH